MIKLFQTESTVLNGTSDNHQIGDKSISFLVYERYAKDFYLDLRFNKSFEILMKGRPLRFSSFSSDYPLFYSSLKIQYHY